MQRPIAFVRVEFLHFVQSILFRHWKWTCVQCSPVVPVGGAMQERMDTRLYAWEPFDAYIADHDGIGGQQKWFESPWGNLGSGNVVGLQQWPVTIHTNRIQLVWALRKSYDLRPISSPSISTIRGSFFHIRTIVRQSAANFDQKMPYKPESMMRLN